MCSQAMYLITAAPPHVPKAGSDVFRQFVAVRLAFFPRISPRRLARLTRHYQACLKKDPKERPASLELMAVRFSFFVAIFLPFGLSAELQSLPQNPFISSNLARDTRRILQDMYNQHVKARDEKAAAKAAKEAAKEVRRRISSRKTLDSVFDCRSLITAFRARLLFCFLSSLLIRLAELLSGRPLRVPTLRSPHEASRQVIPDRFLYVEKNDMLCNPHPQHRPLSVHLSARMPGKELRAGKTRPRAGRIPLVGCCRS